MVRLTALTTLAAASVLLAQTPPLSKPEMAAFLKTAKVTGERELSTGVTNSKKLTLSDGTLTHEAHLQSIDQAMMEFKGARGTELNFKDTWKFNVAAYRLAEMLRIDFMVPMSVERNVHGNSSSVTWWVDDVLMDEVKRTRTKTPPPNLLEWNQQMWTLRVFDQLIYNTDRNLQNLVIDKEWRIWMIDHTRAFRMMKTLQAPKNLEKCDRGLLARLKELNEPEMEQKLKPYLTREEIRGILARRDKIVEFFEKAGPNALYDLTPRVTNRAPAYRASE